MLRKSFGEYENLFRSDAPYDLPHIDVVHSLNSLGKKKLSEKPVASHQTYRREKDALELKRLRDRFLSSEYWQHGRKKKNFTIEASFEYSSHPRKLVKNPQKTTPISETSHEHFFNTSKVTGYEFEIDSMAVELFFWPSQMQEKKKKFSSQNNRPA